MFSLYFWHPFRILFNCYIYPYSKEWDETLSRWIATKVPYTENSQTFLFTFSSGKTAEVWISNKWYAYGCCWSINDKHYSRYRPSLSTMIKLRKLELHEIAKNNATSLRKFQEL